MDWFAAIKWPDLLLAGLTILGSVVIIMAVDL